MGTKVFTQMKIALGYVGPWATNLGFVLRRKNEASGTVTRSEREREREK
jgi:hypothetical protein